MFFCNMSFCNVFLSTLNYFSILSSCKIKTNVISWERLLYTVYAGNPFSQPCTTLCSADHSSESGRLKISLGGETSDKYLVQGRDCLADARKFLNLTVRAPTSFPAMDISPAFFEQPTTLTFIPSFIAPSPHTSTIYL